jgi:hypothetical protein
VLLSGAATADVSAGQLRIELKDWSERMTPYKLVATPVVLVAALMMLGRPAKADELINTDMPVDTVSFDPCTNEDVSLTGIAHVSGSLTVNNNQYHLHAHVNYNIDGIGLTSGVSYESNADGMEDENVEVDNLDLGEASIIARAVIIGPGSLPNAFADVVGHITVNPDGTVTSLVTDVRMSCH